MLYPEIPVDAKTDYNRSEFHGFPPTMYLLAHSGACDELRVDTALGYFLDPYEATDEARRRYNDHGALVVVPVNPFSEKPSFDLKPWTVQPPPLDGEV